MNPVPQNQTTGENPGSEHRRATGELLKNSEADTGALSFPAGADIPPGTDSTAVTAA